MFVYFLEHRILLTFLGCCGDWGDGNVDGGNGNDSYHLQCDDGKFLAFVIVVICENLNQNR